MSAQDLLARYARACELKQAVDVAAIERSLLEWARQIGAPAETRVVPVTTEVQLRNASNASSAARLARDHAFLVEKLGQGHDVAGDPHPRDAKACTAAMAAMAARTSRDARAAWAARAARAARAVREAWEAWDPREAWLTDWDISRECIFAIGAAAIDDDAIDANAIGAFAIDEHALLQKWLPLLEAFEAGAITIWIADVEIFVAPIPHVVITDAANRLHCETGPAFEWMTDIKSYYWHGIEVPKEWIVHRDQVMAAEVFKSTNAEVRRAGCEIIGWDRVLDQIDARLIDEDGDPQIGTLYEGQIPGTDPCGFLKVTCGTGRTFVIPTPIGMTSAIQAQAWLQGVPEHDWSKPEVRG